MQVVHPVCCGIDGHAAQLTVAGLPATAAPLEISASGLSIGVQIVVLWLEDRTTIKFAELLEREFGGFVPPPTCQ